MKLTTTTHVSVDGVMQGLGGPDEDRTGGFDRGGWAIPFFDEEAATFIVASTTLTDPQWTDTTVLAGDVAAAIGELKARQGGELQVHGSGAPVRRLLDHQLVDELTLLVYPLVVGQGARLLPDTGPDAALDLVDSRATSRGSTIQVYRPARRPQYATAAVD